MNPGILDAELARAEKMVVGLGNPGQEYARTRHNLGFRALDAFLKAEGDHKLFESHGKARVQVVEVDGTPVLLARPSTYMNLSGTAVESLLNIAGLSISQLLVIHDEMDLPVGRAKMKVGGGSAGHKGIADIAERCGEDFARIKIGIGRPVETCDDAGMDWVLGEPDAQEDETYSRILPIVAQAVRRWVNDGVEKTMTWFNAEFKPETEEEEAESSSSGEAKNNKDA
jgi:PTH1 family peptidyl-tRNA hydrolase